MGWQERDYARAEPRGPARPPFGPWAGGPRPRSIVTILIVINVAVHFVRPLCPNAPIPVPAVIRDLSVPEGARVAIVEQQRDAPFAVGAMSTGLVLRGQAWRLVTSQYLHTRGSVMHLLVNMIGLYFFGRSLERMWSRRKFLVVYTLAGVAGNIALMIIGATGWINPFIPAIGASGCVLGLLGICAVFFPHAEVYVYMLFPVKIRTVAVVLALGYAYTIWQRGWNFGGDACHLAGLAFGVWWAARGDRWWAIRGSETWAGLFGKLVPPGRPRPSAWQKKMDRRKADAELIDELLAKVYEGGLHSLSPSERKALTEATDRQRRQEKRAGRTDRV
jgi:membrane associated rhomboid family serine protease